MSAKPHLPIVEARFYDDLADALPAGAKAVLDEANAAYDAATVPDALGIRAMISFALDGMAEGRKNYDGFVARAALSMVGLRRRFGV